MPIGNTSTYFQLKITINSKDGAITEKYAMLNSLTWPATVIPAAMKIVAMRGQLLAKGAAEVEAVLSKVDFAGNKADGLAWAPANLYYPILLKKINNSTSETSIEMYGEAGTGIRVELPTVDGRVEQRLLRFVRQSWITQNQIQLTGVVPQAPLVYEAAIVAGFALAAPWVLLSAFVSFVRDNTMMVRRTATDFAYSTFASGGPDWAMVGVGKRDVGYGWPRQIGRQRNWS